MTQIQLKKIEQLLSGLDPQIADILEKALSNKRLAIEEGIQLMEVTNLELNALILTADYLRKSKVGDIVTFIINRNINFTNICTKNCRFCAFSTNKDDPEAYNLSIEQIIKKAREAWKLGATELCIQGGINETLDVDYYAKIITSIKKEIPDIHIHGFSPQEIYDGGQKLGFSIKETLNYLKDAGLNSIPGTASEILIDGIREKICPNKINVETWIKVVKTAHKLQIPTTCTILYGHIETRKDRIIHLDILRKIQEETAGFTEFVPLSFIPWNTNLFQNIMKQNKLNVKESTGIEDIRMYAVSRLFLDNIKNIQVSWVKLGEKLAQYCLNIGANDFGGTLMEESISKSAGATHGEYISPERIKRIILDIGRIPAQRTTTYEMVQ
ncbi:MAG: 5-amino-6-(D-ribitylamino)uracil--L-tyrosine 4-hydroxyphenyl transferase CofH [Candidatus Helarchaeota archaeon]